MRDRVPCESCRVSVDCYRYGPCSMCIEGRVRVHTGAAVCGLCGRSLTRFVLVRKGDLSMPVGSGCAVKQILGGWEAE